jgi:hypothetical protein
MSRGLVLHLVGFGLLVALVADLGPLIGVLATGLAAAAAAAATLAGSGSAPALRPVRVRARRER